MVDFPLAPYRRRRQRRAVVSARTPGRPCFDRLQTDYLEDELRRLARTDPQFRGFNPLARALIERAVLMVKKIEKADSEWRAALSPEEYSVCREHGTERAFSGKYHATKEPGTYVCKCCGTPLFEAAHKFDSGTGWPSFWQPAQDAHVVTNEDTSYGMVRTEVLCAACDAHLGHVFPDGPAPTNLRYCINSVALDLQKADENS